VKEDPAPAAKEQPDGMMEYYERKYGWPQKILRVLPLLGIAILLVGTPVGACLGYFIKGSFWSPYTWVPLASGGLLIIAGEVAYVLRR
jgi:hypothetical protein